MARIISLTCSKGHETRVANPRPGELIRCIYCSEDISIRSGATKVREVSSADPECPSCGDPLQIAFTEKGSDRIGICKPCSYMVDLKDKPELMPIPRTEKRTTWFLRQRIEDELGFAFMMPMDVQKLFLEKPLVKTTRFVRMNGKDFHSTEEFEKHIRAEFPPDMVEEILKAMRDSMGPFQK